MGQDVLRKRPWLNPPDEKPFVLRNILDDLPLQTGSGSEYISITCIEYWNGHFYIGTSASEILHLVALSSEDDADPPTYILASRLRPSGYGVAATSSSPGVKQILVLPGAMKACVLCNDTVSFCTLPELSPMSSKKMEGVQWIGGVDENDGKHTQHGIVVMAATAKRILLVRIGEKLRGEKSNIEYPGCLEASRRGTIACVADGKSYSLLEVEHQQKIPLFPISSVSKPDEGFTSQPSPHGTGRNQSTNLFTVPSSCHSWDKGTEPNERSNIRGESHDGNPTPLNRRLSLIEEMADRQPSHVDEPLKPHVLSPSPEEFMLTTGTRKSEPGRAIFVTRDGDLVSRRNLDFGQYPDAVMVNDFDEMGGEPVLTGLNKAIIALLGKAERNQTAYVLEIQALSEVGKANALSKTWIELPHSLASSSSAGIHLGLSSQQHFFVDLADLLQAVRFLPSRRAGSGTQSEPQTEYVSDQAGQGTAIADLYAKGCGSPTLEYEKSRSDEERKLVRRLCYTKTRAMVWSGDRVWQILRNPLLLQLEQKILQTSAVHADTYSFVDLKTSSLLSVLRQIREHEPQDEIEFRTLRYIRQKASVILFLNLLATLQTTSDLEASCRVVESALHEGGLDPRVTLSLLPPLSWEVLEGPGGIWLEQGIVDCLRSISPGIDGFDDAPTVFWMMVSRYLRTWQEKRGYGSIADDKLVFDSVDSAVLRLLLHMDATLPDDSSLQKSISAELNNVVDNWQGDYDRAVILLEHYRRLYALSRLHQSRKSYRDVLATWKRICEGELDKGRGLSVQGAQQQMRKYLTNRTDANLVQEYGLWLAERDPELGVQVFTDDNGRVRFGPSQVVSMLKDSAPNAVQLYLEHLVFIEHLHQYTDDLVGYYLNGVLSVLESSDKARQSLADSYLTYRAMKSPKPTYIGFVTQSAPEHDWWQWRLRLLRLLGSGDYCMVHTHSIDKVFDRIKPFSQYLISESIILNARQGRHEEALKLIVHDLGDHDDAVRYCYFGGSTACTGTIDANQLPLRNAQSSLFQALYHEFLRIEEIEERLDRTSRLLGTFATWFDPLKILESIPEDWPVTLLSNFLLRSFRALTDERNEVAVMKALSVARCLQ